MGKTKSEVFTGRTSQMRTNTMWLSSEDILDVGDVKVVIEAVFRHKDAEFEAGRTVPECFSLKFKGKDKQLVLNATNRKMLVAMFGAKVTEWTGKEITLYVKPDVPAFGELRNGIRIRRQTMKKKAAGKATSKPADEPAPTSEQPTTPAGDNESAVSAVYESWRTANAADLEAAGITDPNVAFCAWARSTAGLDGTGPLTPEDWIEALPLCQDALGLSAAVGAEGEPDAEDGDGPGD